MNDCQMTQEQRAWMTELDRLGAERGIKGFPMRPEIFAWNCWLEDFDAGLTPTQSIENVIELDHKQSRPREISMPEANIWSEYLTEVTDKLQQLQKEHPSLSFSSLIDEARDSLFALMCRI
jgi:hypothetical protein